MFQNRCFNLWGMLAKLSFAVRLMNFEKYSLVREKYEKKLYKLEEMDLIQKSEWKYLKFRDFQGKIDSN